MSRQLPKFTTRADILNWKCTFLFSKRVISHNALKTFKNVHGFLSYLNTVNLGELNVWIQESERQLSLRACEV